MNLVDHYSPFHIECYLNKKSGGLLKIANYELIYKLRESTQNEWTGDKITNFSIYNADYSIGFCSLFSDTKNWIDGIYDCQLIGYDEDDKILVKLTTKLSLYQKKRYIYRSYRYRGRPNIKFELIDTKNNGFVTGKEWLSSMKKLSTDFKKLSYRRVFYYINFKKNHELYLAVLSDDVEKLMAISVHSEYHLYKDIILMLQSKLHYQTRRYCYY